MSNVPQTAHTAQPEAANMAYPDSHTKDTPGGDFVVSEARSKARSKLPLHVQFAHDAGFNVVPLHAKSKEPALAWKKYTDDMQREEELTRMNWSSGQIGIINGVYYKRTIDLDDCTNPEILFKVLNLLGLDFEYPWVVCSPHGFHIHIICTEPLSSGQNVAVGAPQEPGTFKQMELRWSNSMTVFPPSKHPDGNYDWHLVDPEGTPANILISVVESMFRAMTTQRPPVPDPVEVVETPQEKKRITFDAWAQRAFEQELALLRNAAQGQRNSQLNKTAYALGQIIASGLLDREMVVEELERTSTIIGLEQKEIGATIASGLEAGLKRPRMPRQIYKEHEPPFHLPAAKISDEQLAGYTADDQGHAEAVYAVYGRYLAYNEALGWMIWNGTHYEPSIQRINTLVIDVLRRRQRAAAHMERADLAKVSKSMAGTVNAARSLLENLAFVPVDEFDNEPDLINTQNGVVNLRTKALIPHDPTYRFTWCSYVKYNPDADRSPWLHFLGETIATPEMVGYLQEALGYSISGHTSEECLFYVYGPPRSGKGTLSETLLAILPRPIIMEVDFNSFTAKREGDAQNFDLAPMKAARLVFASESNKYQSLNPAKVKALTGGNLVYCSFKHKDPFSYRPQYTVWLSSNHEINGDPDDDALWGRIKVVSFPHSRLGQEDKTLKRRLQIPTILEGVLAWMIDGAALWYQREGRGLDTPEAVRELTRAQRAEQDSVGMWIEECCERQEGEWTANTAIMTSYQTWCEANGYEPKKAKGLTQSLAAHRFEVCAIKWVSTTPGDKGKATRGVSGLTIL
jgi:putative DNA primase/helicase